MSVLCPTRSVSKLPCLSPLLGKSLDRTENLVPSLPPLSFLGKQITLVFLEFFSPLLLRVSCWQLIFVMQQVISLCNSLVQDVSLAFRVDCVIAWTDGAPKVTTIPVKSSGEEMLQAAFWLPGLWGGYSYRAGYPQTAALDVTFGLSGTLGFLPDLAWTSLSPSLFMQCGIKKIVSWHGCHSDRQGGQALVFTKHASFFISGCILSKCSRLKAEMQSKECAVWYKYMNLWCRPTPPIFSCSHSLLGHYLLVDFMELTRKPDEMSTLLAIAEKGAIVLRSINTSTPQQSPDWGFQCEENTPGQHLLQIAPKKGIVLRVNQKIP